MGRPPYLRNNKPHTERLSTLHAQRVQTSRLVYLVRLRGSGVHFYLLAQIVPVAHWRGRVRSFAQYRYYMFGAGFGRELVEDLKGWRP